MCRYVRASGEGIPTSSVIFATCGIHDPGPCQVIYINFYIYIIIYVTGFWKTDQIITLGLFHYIGPANGYTCTLHIHSTIARLGGLVCFSRVCFTNPVNS